MDSQDSLISTAPLACRVGENADVAQIAEAIRAVWKEIEEALSPIIGVRGVAALYRRSLHLGRAAYPWLVVLPSGTESAMDTQHLMLQLAMQARAEVLAAGNHLFQTFRDLLASLVGPSLTERLLRPVWTDSAGAPPATEAST